MTTLSEADIQTQCINEATFHMWGVIRLNTIKAQTPDGRKLLSYICYAGSLTDGASDLMCFKDGQAVFVEVKRPGQEPRKNQLRFKAWCEWYGMRYEVVTSVDELRTALGITGAYHKGYNNANA